jgi:hypothetical protein
MLIDATAVPRFQPFAELRWHIDERYAIGWKGHVFLPGVAAGAATIARLRDELAHQEIGEVCSTLYGVYGIFVYDRHNNTWWIFADSSGLYRIFYAERQISTSFLELATARSAPSRDVDRQAVLEFLMHSGNFGKRTPVAGIYKLSARELLRLDCAGSGRVEILAKRVAAPAVLGDAFVQEYFATVARSLAHRHVSVDLTGGFDTRVTACLLARQGLAFECAISGMPGTSEIQAASRVAATLGRELHLHQQDTTNLEDDLATVFRAVDGLTELAQFHRNWQMCRHRLDRQIDVMVHSGGGDYFRDHTYVHEFPRYGSRVVDVARYYRLRTVPVRIPPQQLTINAQEIQQTIEDQTIQIFERCRDDNNNKTYDRIYFEIRTPEFYGLACTNYINMGMDVVAPFLDHRMFNVALNMPPWSRVLQRWHRRMVTTHCPNLAVLPTTEGYTASSHPARLILELGNYMRVQSGRVARKLGERLVGKTLFHRVGQLEAEPPGYRAQLRASRLFGRAVERLKANDILAADLAEEQIRGVHVGRILTMGMLLAYLDGEAFGG